MFSIPTTESAFDAVLDRLEAERELWLLRAIETKLHAICRSPPTSGSPSYVGETGAVQAHVLRFASMGSGRIVWALIEVNRHEQAITPVSAVLTEPNIDEGIIRQRLETLGTARLI